jgi:hypothetical protein
MKTWNALLRSSIGVACLAVMGCGVYLGGPVRREPVYVQQEPVYVEQEPQYVVVREAPPPVRIERRPAPVSTAQIWIDGFWNWDNQHYVWVGGRYEIPPQRDVVWVAPRYDHDTQGYRFTPGRWSKPDSGRNPGNGRGRGPDGR